MNKPEYIITHHSTTKDGKTFSWNAIRKYHMDVLGWSDIGYHYGIELIGDSFETFLGRPWYQEGAHTKQESMNRRSLGICLVGNYDIDFVPEGMWKKLLVLCDSLMISHDIPLEKVTGHSEFATYKTCPGLNFDMSKLHQDLYEMINGG